MKKKFKMIFYNSIGMKMSMLTLHTKRLRRAPKVLLYSSDLERS